MFRDRAVALVGTLAPVLVWMRDHKGAPLNIETIRLAFELRCIWKVAMKRAFEVRNPSTGETTDIPVPDMPEDIIYPLKAYLGELPSYDLTLDWNKQKTEEPSKQHGFAQFYFTRTFELLGVSLGHIFKVEQSDVAMRDVVLNRRILVVNLPALESSDERLAALGKIVVASLRGMMAQMLGARLEGDYQAIVANKPGMGAAPFHVVLDEVAYYATSGMDRMLAMGRGLNFMFWLGFQEVSGIWARLGEKTQSLFGSANLTIAMRQQDANRTVICAGNNAPYTEAHPYNFTIPSQSATFPVQSGNQVYTNENLLYVFSWATGPTKTAYQKCGANVPLDGNVTYTATASNYYGVKSQSSVEVITCVASHGCTTPNF